MEIHIRPATADDVPSILNIVNHAILHTTANYHYDVQSIDTQMQWFLDKLSHNFPVIVSEDENSVTGFASYGTFREKIGYQYTVEHSVYVRNDVIGKGAGKKLLAHLINLAKSEKYHVMIGGIDAENTDSIEFHRKFGFIECGTVKDAAFKFGRWLDLLFMQLILSDDIENDQHRDHK